MINTLLIEPDAILDRLDALPELLRIAANDPSTADVVSLTCEDHHITAEAQVLVVQQLVGLVILGFLHDYDLGREINDALGLNNIKLADEIAKAISAKVFAPIKAELDRNYRPLRDVSSAESAGIPRVVSDMKPAASGMPTLIPSSPARSGSPAGISGFAQAPHPATTPFSSAPKPSVIGAMPTTTPTPAPQSMPAPVMLHRETEFRPIQQGSSSLRSDILGKQSPGLGAVSMFSGKPTGNVPQVPVTAKIEFGGSGVMKPQGPTVSRTEVSVPRVVHYSDMKTPLSPFGGATAGGQSPPMPQTPSLAQTPRIEVPVARPVTPSVPPIPMTPQPPRPSAPAIQSMPPSVPRSPVVKEVNYTQPAGNPPAMPSPSQVSRSETWEGKPAPQPPPPGMADLKAPTPPTS